MRSYLQSRELERQLKFIYIYMRSYLQSRELERQLKFKYIYMRSYLQNRELERQLKLWRDIWYLITYKVESWRDSWSDEEIHEIHHVLSSDLAWLSDGLHYLMFNHITKKSILKSPFNTPILAGERGWYHRLLDKKIWNSKDLLIWLYVLV